MVTHKRIVLSKQSKSTLIVRVRCQNFVQRRIRRIKKFHFLICNSKMYQCRHTRRFFAQSTKQIFECLDVFAFFNEICTLIYVIIKRPVKTDNVGFFHKQNPCLFVKTTDSICLLFVITIFFVAKLTNHLNLTVLLNKFVNI